MRSATCLAGPGHTPGGDFPVGAEVKRLPEADEDEDEGLLMNDWRWGSRCFKHQRQHLFETADVGLVRDLGDDLEGIVDRQWVYIEDGKLPERFEGGAKVPARFHKQLKGEQK